MATRNYQTFDNEAQPLLADTDDNLELIPKPKVRCMKKWVVNILLVVAVTCGITYLINYEGKTKLHTESENCEKKMCDLTSFIFTYTSYFLI